MIPYGRQDISEEDIQAVVSVLRSNMLTTGPLVDTFERHLSEYCGAQDAVVFNSATSALHVACLALGLGEGDVVWTSPLSFVASANCALYSGADVDFVDICPNSYLMDVNQLSEKLQAAKKNNRLPKIVIPVHFAGQSCDMESIHNLSKEYGFKIIEDAAHAIGGTYEGEPVGSCKFSDITIFSFHPVKLITTGEGGAALTNKKPLSDLMKKLRSHGIERNFKDKPEDQPWLYAQECLGYNYRLTDISAALGISQLKRLDEFVDRRHKLSRIYDDLLNDLPLKLPIRNTESKSAIHLYPVLIESEHVSRNQVYHHMINNGVGVQIHYQPIHTQPFYRRRGFSFGDFPKAEAVYEKILSLPLFPRLTEDEQNHVINSMSDILK